MTPSKSIIVAATRPAGQGAPLFNRPSAAPQALHFSTGVHTDRPELLSISNYIVYQYRYTMNSVRREIKDTTLQLEWLESLVCSDDRMMAPEPHSSELAAHSASVSAE